MRDGAGGLSTPCGVAPSHPRRAGGGGPLAQPGVGVAIDDPVGGGQRLADVGCAAVAACQRGLERLLEVGVIEGGRARERSSEGHVALSWIEVRWTRSDGPERLSPRCRVGTAGEVSRVNGLGLADVQDAAVVVALVISAPPVALLMVTFRLLRT